MANYTSMYIKSQKGTKMKMKTIVGLYGKENEVISRCFYVGLCLVLSGNCCCMCYCCQNSCTKFGQVELIMTTFT
jgi:hypothetical protein